MTVSIHQEQQHDRKAVWKLNRISFGSETEANLVNDLRTDGFVSVSHVAECDGRIVGHILFSRLQIMTAVEAVEAVSLAPMCVHPDFQRQGIGSQLVNAGLEACRKQGHKVVVVLGHSDFYPRFGFSAELAKRLESPFGGGDVWMALELVPGSLDGIKGRVEYPPPFDAFK